MRSMAPISGLLFVNTLYFAIVQTTLSKLRYTDAIHLLWYEFLQLPWFLQKTTKTFLFTKLFPEL